MASDNLNRADNDLRDHPGVPKLLRTNANGLRDGYRAALGINPNLKFGEYVSATRVSQNLGGRFPNVTRSNILSGLASGRSLGQTLQDLGVGERDAKDAKKQAEREIRCRQLESYRGTTQDTARPAPSTAWCFLFLPW